MSMPANDDAHQSLSTHCDHERSSTENERVWGGGEEVSGAQRTSDNESLRYIHTTTTTPYDYTLNNTQYREGEWRARATH